MIVSWIFLGRQPLKWAMVRHVKVHTCLYIISESIKQDLTIRTWKYLCIWFKTGRIVTQVNGGRDYWRIKEFNISELSFNLKISCTNSTELLYALPLAFPSGDRFPSPGTILTPGWWQRDSWAHLQTLVHAHLRIQAKTLLALGGFSACSPPLRDSASVSSLLWPLSNMESWPVIWKVIYAAPYCLLDRGLCIFGRNTYALLSALSKGHATAILAC